MFAYQLSVKILLEKFQENPEIGLTPAQVGINRKNFGLNVLASKKKETNFEIFIRQFQSPLIYILLSAGILILLFGEKTDATTVFLVVTINAIIGTFQEGKARNSLEKLKKLTQQKALVRRNGEEQLLSVEEVVPGDILILREGDKVCADARIISALSLKSNESILTGEVYSVEKYADDINKNEVGLGDQRNMLFSGTSITSGFGEAIVVATGLSSELGKISKELLETSNIPLPLVNKINELTRFIGFSVFFIGTSIFFLGLFQGIPLNEIFIAVIGLSVSIIPEGLPVVVTIVLASGVWRMAQAKAVVRQMAAVEAMGGVDILMVDKTGTITTGQMIIKQVLLGEEKISVTGSGYDPSGEILVKTNAERKKLTEILSLTYLALKADILKDKDQWKPVGDATESSVAVLCRKAGLSKTQLETEYETVSITPFDSKKRYLEGTFKRDNETWNVYVGAPEFLSRDLKIDHHLNSEYQQLAREGLRVVGVAVFGPSKKLFDFCLLAIEEEIRSQVSESVAIAQKIGIRVVMLTGDYPETAKAIARTAGIYEDGQLIIDGEELNNLTDGEIREKLNSVSVFARITPSHKLRIVNIFKNMGHIVAMTGDGVNDGPALQAANLGIGLGTGTQVAQDASDIVLIDDNFSTIVNAVSEGRAIYLTLKKVISYLLSTSAGEALVIGVALLVGMPLPVVAVQIIWLNFVTDGFLDISIAQDLPEKNVFLSTRHGNNLIDGLMIRRTILVGVSMLVATLPIFYYSLQHLSITESRSVALLILSLTQWFNALNVRSISKSVFRTPLNNKFLLVALIIVFILQIFALQTGLGNELLHTTPLSLSQWLLAVAVSSIVIVTEEIRKFFVRRKTSNLYI